MGTVTGWILLSFLLTFGLAPIIIHILYRYRIVRKTDTDFSAIVGERYLKAGTPIMGGLMMIISILLLTIIFNWHGSTVVPIVVLIISALLGGFDDVMNIYGRKRVIRTVDKQIKLAKVHKHLSKRIFYWITLPWAAYKNIWFALGSYPGNGIHAGEKILIQLFVGCLVAWWIFFRLGWSVLWIPVIGEFDIGILMPLVVIGLVMIMTNAVNISDGMDGLASGMLVPSFIAYLLIAIQQEQHEIAILCAITIGALLAYIYFNIKPARVEMGDVGTLALGALLATVALALRREFLLPIVGGLFFIEIGSSLLQGVYRKIVGRRLLKMAPLHLHLQVRGWSEEKTVMRFWLFSVIFAILGLWISQF